MNDLQSESSKTDLAHEDALESILITARRASTQDCIAVIKSVIGRSDIFVFGEILDLPNVQALGQLKEGKPYLDLLQIFAYGTWQDYQKSPDLPALSEAEQWKLKHLSAVSLAETAKVLRYDTLLRELGLSTNRQLEDLLISCSDKGLMEVELDPRNGIVRVHGCMGRDIGPGDLAKMQAALKSWLVATEESKQAGQAGVAKAIQCDQTLQNTIQTSKGVTLNSLLPSLVQSDVDAMRDIRLTAQSSNSNQQQQQQQSRQGSSTSSGVMGSG